MVPHLARNDALRIYSGRSNRVGGDLWMTHGQKGRFISRSVRSCFLKLGVISILASSLSTDHRFSLSAPGARRMPQASAIISSEYIFETAPVASAHASAIVQTNEGLVAAWY